jgi:membrane-associated protein
VRDSGSTPKALDGAQVTSSSVTSLAMIDPLKTAGPLMVWLVVLGFVYAECSFIIGMFLPGDSLLLAAGVLLAQHDREFDAWALSACTVVVALCGNQTGYTIGERTGTRLLARQDGRVLNRRNLAKAEQFFERWGFWAVVTARWLPFVRTLAPMFAGAGRMNRRRFTIASAFGAVAWVPLLILLGFYGAGQLDFHHWLKPLATGMASVMFTAGTAYGVWRYRQEMRKPVDDGALLVPSLHQ